MELGQTRDLIQSLALIAIIIPLVIYLLYTVLFKGSGKAWPLMLIIGLALFFALAFIPTCNDTVFDANIDCPCIVTKHARETNYNKVYIQSIHKKYPFRGMWIYQSTYKPYHIGDTIR